MVYPLVQAAETTDNQFETDNLDDLFASLLSTTCSRLVIIQGLINSHLIGGVHIFQGGVLD